MRVLLISANTETINMVPLPLGLNCVAVAVRDAGHEVKMIDLMGNGDNRAVIEGAVKRLTPQVIGISVRNIDDQKMTDTKFLLDPVREAVSICRELSCAPIVLGGAGYSIFPAEVLGYLRADMGVRCEGEAVFPALLAAMEQGRDLATIPGLSLAGDEGEPRPAVPSPLDALPLPDPHLWHIPAGCEADLWIPFQTRRGCPMKCSYCSTPCLEGTAIRTRQLDDVVAGLSAHVAAGFSRFYFVDNIFNVPLPYAKKLCAAIDGAGLRVQWRCILYPGQIDEELVALMAKAGCVEVSLGFESGSPPVLRELNKKYSPSEVTAAAEMLARHGIRRMGFLLLGGPGETPATVMESLAFADTLRLDMLKLTTGIRIYPGTALEQTAVADGRIPPGSNLLFPTFYLAKGLEPWLSATLAEWMAERPWCVT